MVYKTNEIVFEKNWKLMVDDYSYELQHRHTLMHYSITNSELGDMLLGDLEYGFSKKGAHINMFNLSKTTFSNMHTDENRLIEDDLIMILIN